MSSWLLDWEWGFLVRKRYSFRRNNREKFGQYFCKESDVLYVAVGFVLLHWNFRNLYRKFSKYFTQLWTSFDLICTAFKPCMAENRGFFIAGTDGMKRDRFMTRVCFSSSLEVPPPWDQIGHGKLAGRCHHISSIQTAVKTSYVQ